MLYFISSRSSCLFLWRSTLDHDCYTMGLSACTHRFKLAMDKTAVSNTEATVESTRGPGEFGPVRYQADF